MGSGRGVSAVAARELRAAGVRQPSLRAAYLRCRELNAAHGRTYFLASRLLPASQRPAIHALYGFARWVDDLVDSCAPLASGDRAEALDRVESQLGAALALGRSEHPLLTALVDTAQQHRLEPDLFTDFVASMRMDLTVSDYPTRAALDRYMYGSAAVIGLQVLPVLGTVSTPADAAPYAARLGRAFQLTNFLRDIAEDLDRGRVYLPTDELSAFGVDRERLLWCRRTGRSDAAVRRALSDQVARTRAVYRAAEPGIGLLSPRSRPCVATAFTLYSEILDRIVDSGYEVFGARATVPAPRRLGVAAQAYSAVALSRVRELTRPPTLRSTRV